MRGTWREGSGSALCAALHELPPSTVTGHPALSWIQLDTFDGNELGSLLTIATKTGDTTHQGRAPFERAAE